MPIAIRAITRIQDADDANFTLGAGQDGHAIVWDNGTSNEQAICLYGEYITGFGLLGEKLNYIAKLGEYITLFNLTGWYQATFYKLGEYSTQKDLQGDIPDCD